MRLALYFGCLDNGHFLHGVPGIPGGRTIDPRYDIPGFPWTIQMLDSGLLTNGRVHDEPDGLVTWTCGGINVLWHAFYWWDRSGDSRASSNSGFYVRGFRHEENVEAFRFACETWPRVVGRQLFSLVLR